MIKQIRKLNFSSIIICVSRISLGLLWIENSGWKSISDNFGKKNNSGLYYYTKFCSTKPVLGFMKPLVDNIILPNFTFFGWMSLITEATLGAFILFGLYTRFFSLLGAFMSITIALTVLNAPNEWPWSYYLLLMANLLMFASCAGRHGGLDVVLRKFWINGKGRITKLFLAVS